MYPICTYRKRTKSTIILYLACNNSVLRISYQEKILQPNKQTTGFIFNSCFRSGNIQNKNIFNFQPLHLTSDIIQQ